MCDYFDYYDGEFMDEGIDDGFDDGIENSTDLDFDDDLNQEDDQSDGFDVADAFFTGGLFGFAYEEGRRERRKRRNTELDKYDDIS